MAYKRWQNLIHKKCPKCGEELVEFKDKGMLYECRTDGCRFIISRVKYAEILMDEEHIMRRFLNREERAALTSAILKLQA